MASKYTKIFRNSQIFCPFISAIKIMKHGLDFGYIYDLQFNNHDKHKQNKCMLREFKPKELVLMCYGLMLKTAAPGAWSPNFNLI